MTSLRVDAEVAENRDEGGANRRLRLRVPDWPGSAPGQFVMLSPGVRSSVERFDPLLPRPMAVYRVHDGCLEVLYKVTGRGTALLADARSGERVRVVGPLGKGFPESVGKCLLVGGGTGIASLYDLAARDRERSHVLLGARSQRDLMGQEDFAALGVALSIATEDGSTGSSGLVTALLERELETATNATVFACGPTPMMRASAEIAAKHGARCFVSLENPMACGIGVCQGCAAPRANGGYALVCRDGPVFDANEVLWEAMP